MLPNIGDRRVSRQSHTNSIPKVEWLKCQKRISAKPENRCVVVAEAGSYLRLIDFCITQLKAQRPSRTCNESKEEEEEAHQCGEPRLFLASKLTNVQRGPSMST